MKNVRFFCINPDVYRNGCPQPVNVCTPADGIG
jgi:hypothetical protein